MKKIHTQCRNCHDKHSDQVSSRLDKEVTSRWDNTKCGLLSGNYIKVDDAHRMTDTRYRLITIAYLDNIMHRFAKNNISVYWQ